MKAQQIAQIKSYQKDFFNKFNEKLPIDWLGANNIQTKQIIVSSRTFDLRIATSKLEEICIKYGTTREIVINMKRICKQTHPDESDALNEFLRWTFSNQYSFRQTAKLINKDRTAIYHRLYGKKSR